MERSLSLATVRSASSPRFMSPPPTASMIKTSEEKPSAPPAGHEQKVIRATSASFLAKHLDPIYADIEIYSSIAMSK